MPTPALPQCLCGARFDSYQHLLDHVSTKGHRYRCSCRLLFKDSNASTSHRSLTKHDGSREAADVTKFIDHPEIDRLGVGVCRVCRKTFKDAVAVSRHRSDKHDVCPICFQVFDSKPSLSGHQKTTGHCYCDEHDIAFASRKRFKDHQRSESHTTGFECLDCDRNFKSQRALDHHVASCQANAPQHTTGQQVSVATEAKHAEIEEANLRCEACDKNFTSIHAQRQHKKSVKHNPLSEIHCLLSVRCKQVFTSPSAYIFHLESGKCKSGMNRYRLNRLVHAEDTQNRTTYSENTCPLAPAGATDVASLISVLSHLSMSSTSGDLLTPSQSDAMSSIDESSQGGGTPTLIDTDVESIISSSTTSTASMTSGDFTSATDPPLDDGWAQLTPAPTLSDSSSTTTGRATDVPGASDDEDAATISSDSTSGAILTPSITATTSTGGAVFTPTSNGWVCGICDKVFRKQSWLLQHLDSPAHEDKLYHCGGFTAAVGTTNMKSRPVKKFKTLSGFAQHVEAGSCTGGKEMLQTVVEIFEGGIRGATGQAVTLLH